MRRQKQEAIFSRIEGIEPVFETVRGKEDKEPAGPAKNEAEGKNPPYSMPVSAAEHADIRTEEPFHPLIDAVSDDAAGEIAPPQPEPVPTHQVSPVYRPTPGVDILASLENAFVLIAPGTFLMGSPDYEAGRGSDEIIHEVTLTKAFYMQNTPVTQGLWKAVMGTNPASFRDDGDSLPVESITWTECQEFLRKLNSINESKYRLPTEAEWEYACRAESSAPFCNGEISELYCGLDQNLSEAGWYCGNSGRRSRAVARKTPNAWGLFDMHGNVSEWCRDWYGDYPAEPQTDPCGPKSGPGKVVRGGSWFGNAKNCRSASRFHWPPNLKSDSIGFRLVREP